jgi:predicted DNA-binding transcriptional regulator AlpA
MLLSPRDVMAMIGCSASGLRNLRARGEFPQPIRLTPKLLRWRPTDSARWLDEKHTEQMANSRRGLA